MQFTVHPPSLVIPHIEALASILPGDSVQLACGTEKTRQQGVLVEHLPGLEARVLINETGKEITAHAVTKLWELDFPCCHRPKIGYPTYLVRDHGGFQHLAFFNNQYWHSLIVMPEALPYLQRAETVHAMSKIASRLPQAELACHLGGQSLQAFYELCDLINQFERGNKIPPVLFEHAFAQCGVRLDLSQWIAAEPLKDSRVLAQQRLVDLDKNLHPNQTRSRHLMTRLSDQLPRSTWQEDGSPRPLV